MHSLFSFQTRQDDPSTTIPPPPDVHHASPVVAFIIGLAIVTLASVLNAAGLNLTKLDHVSDALAVDISTMDVSDVIHELSCFVVGWIGPDERDSEECEEERLVETSLAAWNVALYVCYFIYDMVVVQELTRCSIVVCRSLLDRRWRCSTCEQVRIIFFRREIRVLSRILASYADRSRRIIFGHRGLLPCPCLTMFMLSLCSTVTKGAPVWHFLIQCTL